MHDLQTDWLVFVGTYTISASHPQGREDGIYIFRFDTSSGELDQIGSVKGVVNPAFLALAPNGRILYAVNETREFQGQPGGGLSALAIEPSTGRLRLLNQVRSQGIEPCHIHLDIHSKWAFVANYASGSLSVFPVQTGEAPGEAAQVIQHEGHGKDPQRQREAHIHSSLVDPSSRFLLVADLGIDQIRVYRIGDAPQPLIPNDPPGISLEPGAGPRHMAFHPNRPVVYSVNELASTVSIFAFDAESGSLSEIQTHTVLPRDFHGENSAADIQLTPDGRFLYCSNRGHDSLAAFRVTSPAGKLETIDHFPTGGKSPRNFAIHPNGRWLLAANQKSDRIQVFSIDPDSGRLAPAGRTVEIPEPACILIGRG